MKKFLLFQLDGATPNHALMRLSAHFKAEGGEVELRRAYNFAALERNLFDAPDAVFASAIFEDSRPLCRRLLEIYPSAVVGGSGWNETITLEDVGVPTEGPLDYSLYPRYFDSMAFTLRGCRLKCSFCKVPKMEGALREATPIERVWRETVRDPATGETREAPRHLLLLDNDFFGSKIWERKIEYIRAGKFKVCITQGINARLGTQVKYLNEENAAALASVRYYDKAFKKRRLYTAWDNLPDEERLFAGLEALKKYGVKPDHVMVYMLVGFWPKETREGWEHRRARLRAWGARPYPMPFRRTPEAVGFQRWVIGAYDKPREIEDPEAFCRSLGKTVAELIRSGDFETDAAGRLWRKAVEWHRWEAAGYRPERLGFPETQTLLDDAESPDEEAAA